MKQQVTEVNYAGQMVYAGIDVHKKQWYVSTGFGHTQGRSFSQPPQAEVLYNYLRRNYPGGQYQCAYEAGYCGYWIHEQLTQLGIDCLVVNPSDIPSTDKERKHKTDKRDSQKLLKALQAQQLQSIYIPNKVHQQDRALLRTREAVIKATRRIKNQIKSKLLFFGIELPAPFNGCRWSKRFINWLSDQAQQEPLRSTGLDFQIEHLVFLRQHNLDMLRRIRALSRTPAYAESCDLLISIPGIGVLTAMKYLIEMGPVERFRNLDHHASFIGLVPRMYNSGDKERHGAMTKRGSKIVKTALIESAWIAKRYDPTLTLKFEQLVKRMKPAKAIIIIAKKLLSRVRFVLKNRQVYQKGRI